MMTHLPSHQAISYLRVSTESQGETGVGLESQRSAIKAYADVERLVIVKEFKDVASGAGSLSKRNGLVQALELAKAEGLPLLVFDASRISRVADIILRLGGERNVQIIYVTEGAVVSPASLASLAARAEHERRAISERTAAALQKLKAKGVRLGNTKNLKEAQQKGAKANEHRARIVVERIADVLQDLGPEETQMSVNQLANVLNERGVLTGRKGRWTIGALRRPLAQARALLKERANAERAQNPLWGAF